MTITVRLEKNHGRLLSRDVFILSENDNLSVEFDCDAALLDCAVCVQTPTVTKTLREKNLKTLEIPREWLAEGDVKIVISALVKGYVVNRYAVEPISVRACDAGFEGYNAIDEIRHTSSEAAQTAQEALRTAEALRVELVSVQTAIDGLRADLGRLRTELTELYANTIEA